jgi:hypothetical protein
MRSRRWRVGLGVAGAVLVVAALAAYLLASRIVETLPPERVRALEVLAEPMPPVAGRDASDALWLLDHDVPREQHARVAAEVRAYLDARMKLREAGDKNAAKRLHDPRSRFARYPDLGKSPGLCQEMMDSCLAHVRKDPAATAASLRTHAKALQARLAFAEHDGVRYGVLDDELTPPINLQGLVLTGFAARFAAGETDAALAGTCAHLGGWRRLGGDTDMMEGIVMGAAYVIQDVRLLAQMLAELPVDHPLPAECTAALAPTAPVEYDVCPVIRREFRALPRMLEQTKRDARPGNLVERALTATFNPHHVAAVQAPRYARYCGEDMLRHAQAARPARDVPRPALRCGSLERLVHPFDCSQALLRRGMDGDYDAFVDRRTDQAQALALMRTLLWLRAQSPVVEDWPGLLAQRPASLGLRSEPRIDAAGLSIPRLYTRNWKRTELAIRPPAKTDAAH